MVSDLRTQQDLEILRARDGGPSVLGSIDRTVTRQGRARLGEILRTPLASAREIRARQDAIEHLHASRFRLPISDASLRKVREYVESNYSTLRRRGMLRRLVEGSWVFLRYRDMLRHAVSGIQAVRRLLEVVDRIIAPLEVAALPVELERLCREIRDVWDRLSSAPLQASASYVPYIGVLEADRKLRDDHRGDLLALLRLLAELDVLRSAADLLDRDYCLPDVVDGSGNQLEGVGLWHPFLPNGVSNPISLRGGETLVFLTGPNMAGKTTYLKSVGVCVHLAQCGLPVPAQRFSFTPVDRFITGLSPEDNLREGVSYFLAEVRRVKEVVEAVVRGERTIAIFDEVFRGTNVSDALDASKAVLTGCSRARSSIFIFSSHLVELAEELAREENVKFCYFEGNLDESELRFDYRLRSGVSKQRFGMELMRREGVPDLLASIPTS